MDVSGIIFDPVFIEKPRGGSFLTGEKGIGEAFLLSEIKGSVTSSNGTPLTDMIQSDPSILGNHILSKYGKHLPIYLKVLDSISNLSIQVHPNDGMAQQIENEALGKSEAWYILNAEEGAGLYLGFKEDVTYEEFQDALSLGKDLSPFLNFVPVQKGDAFFIPAGMIHALGKGVRVLEPQQSSNTTYRVWDWNRVDENGNRRELHIEKSLKVLNFTPAFNSLHSKKVKKEGNTVLKTPYFDVDVITKKANEPVEIRCNNTYVIVTLIKGKTLLPTSETVSPGRAILLPGNMVKATLKSMEETTYFIVRPK